MNHIPELGQLDPTDGDIGIFYPNIEDLIAQNTDKLVVRRFPDEPATSSYDFFNYTLGRLESAATKNGFNTLFVAKTVTDTDHGKPQDETIFWMNFKDIPNRIKYLKYLHSHGVNASLLLSGVTKVKDNLYFSPTLDLEFPTTDVRLLSLASEKLAHAGLAGSLFNSGYGEHYISDFFLPYNKSYWQMFGYMMQNLTYDETVNPYICSQSLEFGKRLFSAQTQEESIGIAREMLEVFPSLPTGVMRPGLLFDPRWIGHRLIPSQVINKSIAVNTLRISTGKDYEQRPRFDYAILMGSE